MREKITYIAFDGKEFENEDECVVYEHSAYNNKYGGTLRGYDEFGKKLTLTDMEEFSQKVMYVICDTDESADWITTIMDNEGCPWGGIEGAGRYWYDSNSNWWQSKKMAVNILDEAQFRVDILNESIHTR